MNGWNGRSAAITRTTGRLSAIVLVSLVGAGCYTYTPISQDLVPVGEEVRMVVTRAGITDLANEMELGAAAPVLLGQVTGREPGILLVRVPRPTAPSIRTSGVELAQIARIPTDALLSLEQRQFSSGRTAAVVGATAGAVTFLVLSIIDASGSDSGDGGDGIVLAVTGIPIG